MLPNEVLLLVRRAWTHFPALDKSRKAYFDKTAGGEDVKLQSIGLVKRLMRQQE